MADQTADRFGTTEADHTAARSALFPELDDKPDTYLARLEFSNEAGGQITRVAEALAAARRGGYERGRRDGAAEEERALMEELAERDRVTEIADRLAYAIAPVEVIGEHSSANDPWQNALAVAAARVLGTDQ